MICILKVCNTCRRTSFPYYIPGPGFIATLFTYIEYINLKTICMHTFVCVTKLNYLLNQVLILFYSICLFPCSRFCWFIVVAVRLDALMTDLGSTTQQSFNSWISLLDNHLETFSLSSWQYLFSLKNKCASHQSHYITKSTLTFSILAWYVFVFFLWLALLL